MYFLHFMRLLHKNQYAIFAYSKMEETRGGGKSMYQRLRNLREDRDLTQAAVAALLHVSQTT